MELVIVSYAFCQRLKGERRVYEAFTQGPPHPAGVQKKRSAGWNSNAARPPVGRDKEEVPQSITDMLPDWMGYGFLYFVTIIPAIIVVITVSIVFFSSLK